MAVFGDCRAVKFTCKAGSFLIVCRQTFEAPMSERFYFPSARGERLGAILDWPVGEPLAYALLIHCFTCGKDNLAAKWIAEALTLRGMAVLRFDFTGLGVSEGEFASTNFAFSVADAIAAADYMRRAYRAPAILVGHSLGGAAVLAAAPNVVEAQAVVTIAAPSDSARVAWALFNEHVANIRERGEVEVRLAGRPFRVRREFLEDMTEQRLTERLAHLNRALLIFHSPMDNTVSIDNAETIFAAAKHPKSFVSLGDADHLLSHRDDAIYVAHVIAAWAKRYLEAEHLAERHLIAHP
jgi:alpha-beta hydrolase superfamily lysophospholipase